MAGSAKKIIIVVIIVVVIIVVGVVVYKYQQKPPEKFVTNSITHIGGLEDIPREYFNTSNINQIGSPQSYNLIGSSNPPENGYYNPFLTEKFSSGENKTIQRLDRVDDKLIPKTVNNVTPYDVDVADPQFYIYQVQPPRVLKKDPQAMLADPMRGDIPIRSYPDIPIIERSQYGRDSLRLDGTFSEALNGLYGKYTGGAFFNIPQHTSLGATIAS
jgi:hypothetical protein